MKRKTKIITAIATLSAGVVLLSSCTASFCTVEDKSQMMYAYDVYHVTKTDSEGNKTQVKVGDTDEDLLSYGISTYYDAGNAPAEAVLLDGFSNIYVTYDIASNLALTEINKTAASNGITVNNYNDFWFEMDKIFVNLAISAAANSTTPSSYVTDKSTMTYQDLKKVLIGDADNQTRGYGYVKYCGLNADNNQDYWVNWDLAYTQVFTQLGQDYCPNVDYVAQYKTSMNTYAGTTVSCIATKDGFYGYYGFNDENKQAVFISSKTYRYGWSKGFLEGLLIFPFSWLIDNIAINIAPGLGGITNGWAQLLSILIVTFIIRAVMMLITIKQTVSQQKMSQLQPQLAAIQQKYPNANTNQYERQQMAQEQQALYKKNHVNPFLSIITMIIQFPVFICVWGAMNGSAILSSGTLLGLRLNTSVSSVVTQWSNWSTGANGLVTAIILYVVMAALQVVSMLLPQIINKKKQASVAKTAVNNNAKKQNNTMKWFTIIMVIMIVFMGFTLASGMVIYWIAGSIWAIAQTLIIELINKQKNNKNKNKNKGVKTKVTAQGEDVDAEVIPDYMAAPTGKKKYKGNK